MKKYFFLLILLFATPVLKANVFPLSDEDIKNVILTGSGQPQPRIIDDPVALYNTSTDVLTITLDATYYGEYTITIESTLTTVDYYPISATTVIPLTGADNNITIYIDSDDCGCWYGELDKAEFGGPLGN